MSPAKLHVEPELIVCPGVAVTLSVRASGATAYRWENIAGRCHLVRGAGWYGFDRERGRHDSVLSRGRLERGCLHDLGTERVAGASGRTDSDCGCSVMIGPTASPTCATRVPEPS
jgi:hypothetical protein